VEWTEFVAACLDLSSETLDGDLKQIFARADRDGDGCLGMTDLAALLSDLLGADVVWGNVRQTLFELSGKTDVEAKVDWSSFQNHFRDISVQSLPESPEEDASRSDVSSNDCSADGSKAVDHPAATSAAEHSEVTSVAEPPPISPAPQQDAITPPADQHQSQPSVCVHAVDNCVDTVRFPCARKVAMSLQDGPAIAAAAWSGINPGDVSSQAESVAVEGSIQKPRRWQDQDFMAHFTDLFGF
jgi:hypothetical protein